MRVFGSQSLTKTATVARSTAVDPNFPDLAPENLLQNLDNRSISTQRLTYDRTGVNINGVDYCYRVRADELYNDHNGLYELTLKF